MEISSSIELIPLIFPIYMSLGKYGKFIGK